MLTLQMLLVAGALGAAPDAVLLSFSQADCVPCRAMEPVVAELEASGLAVQPVAVEQHPDFVRRFQVAGTPTYVMTVGGRETGRIVGVTSAEKLRSLYPSENREGTARGQSPDSPNYLQGRLGGLFGKGGESGRSNSAATSASSSATDPFTQRQLHAPEARHASYETNVPNEVDPQARAMAATVRLKVEEPSGQAIGTGTIIDTHGDEAVLITCAHIFRESKGKGKIQVEIFHPQPETVEGTLIEYNLQRDIAVVSIKPGTGVVSAPVAPTSLTVSKQDAAFSVGCDKGADPTIRQTMITNLNRYVGPPNIEAKGEPTIGRSGGGLFSKDGYLIGICNCADAQDDEGIYAATASIHWQLEKVGLAEVFREPSRTEEAPRTGEVATVGFDTQDLSEASPRPVAAAPSQNDLEIIAIVRSRSNPTGKGNVIVIPKASQQLLQQIAADSGDATTAADLALTADRRSAAAPLGSRGPVVRGQSQR